MSHRPMNKLQNNLEYPLPLSPDQRDSFCRKLGGIFNTVGIVTIESPDEGKNHIDVKNCGVLWLSEFTLNRSKAQDDSQYSSDDLLILGYPVDRTSLDPLSPIQKKLHFFIEIGLVSTHGGRRHRKYSINPDYTGRIKYLDTDSYRMKSQGCVYEIDLL